MAQVHSSSVISKEAELADDVYVGPFCVITGKVKIDSGTRLESHVSVGNEFGKVTIGKNNRMSPGSVVGGPPQDLSYKGDPTELVIGDNNEIRECATLNCGTFKEKGITRIGNGNLIMAYSHVAHDCALGDRVVLANSCQLAGHVKISDDVKIGGVVCVNQFVRLGEHAYIAGDSTVNKDVAPFTIAQGKYAVMRAANQIGMERAGIDKEEIDAVRRAVRFLTKGNLTLEEVLSKIEQECPPSKSIATFVDFIKTSERGLAR